ncbi:ABC transporter ATP-binding protein [Carnimonas nigrificans]|uniref:ABC transporter ATP-binding protein n=1 Tax=Carnimonas nigrificans TaxID=64323 RepID=UPI0004729E91|nr:sn-glycerol-3-phosphate ABC transporter ATP-binding protein UgpC [Carnimonas nigrificans]
MAIVELNNVSKHYGDKGPGAVEDFNLRTRDGEFIVLVGPSGCGKTTTMRMIAGLEQNTGGDILFNEQEMSGVPAKHRDIAMVFQSYALYPHMSVHDNMAFSLKLKKIDKTEIKQRVEAAAKILGIEHLLDRKPRALSGGQRQRVALGRAIVREPQVFLMDEPLSNLDARLRVEMRAEIVKLHRRLKVTTFYVTHDQVEAMTMGERIVVMNAGHIQQVGTPDELYDSPDNMFVAGFIGTPSMNFIKMRRHGEQLQGTDASLALEPWLKDKVPEGEELWVGIRPEHLRTVDDSRHTREGIRLRGKIEVIEPLGAVSLIQLKTGEHRITTQLEGRPRLALDQELELVSDMSRLHYFGLDERNLTVNAPAAEEAASLQGHQE